MSHVTNAGQGSLQITGYPFNRGQWVGPDLSTPQPPLAPAAPTDSVCLSSKAVKSTSPSSGCVTVKSGDSLSQLLLDRGYSVKEMFQKDAEGKTMIDRLASSNGLRNPNLIYPGQELNLPSKECPQDQEVPEIACETSPVETTDDSFDQKVDAFGGRVVDFFRNGLRGFGNSISAVADGDFDRAGSELWGEKRLESFHTANRSFVEAWNESPDEN